MPEFYLNPSNIGHVFFMRLLTDTTPLVLRLYKRSKPLWKCLMDSQKIPTVNTRSSTSTTPPQQPKRLSIHADIMAFIHWPVQVPYTLRSFLTQSISVDVITSSGIPKIGQTSRNIKDYRFPSGTSRHFWLCYHLG